MRLSFTIMTGSISCTMRVAVADASTMMNVGSLPPTYLISASKILTENGCFDILLDRHRLFNCDETAVRLNPDSGRVLTKKEEAAYKVSPKDGRPGTEDGRPSTRQAHCCT